MISTVFGKFLFIGGLRTKPPISTKSHMLHNMSCFVNLFIFHIAVACTKMELNAHHCRICHINQQPSGTVFQSYLFNCMLHQLVLTRYSFLFSTLFAVLSRSFFLFSGFFFNTVNFGIRLLRLYSKVIIAICFALAQFVHASFNRRLS